MSQIVASAKFLRIFKLQMKIPQNSKSFLVYNLILNAIEIMISI